MFFAFHRRKKTSFVHKHCNPHKVGVVIWWMSVLASLSRPIETLLVSIDGDSFRIRHTLLLSTYSETYIALSGAHSWAHFLSYLQIQPCSNLLDNSEEETSSTFRHNGVGHLIIKPFSLSIFEDRYKASV